MKNKFLLSVIFLTIIAFSCEKVNDLLSFYVQDEVNFTIENKLGFELPFEIPLPNIKSNASSEFENNNTKASLVKDVSLEELKMSITSPLDKSFSFLKAIHIYISADGVEETEIAYLDDISSDAQTITLITTGAKLDEYIKAESYSLRTKVTLRETLTTDIDLKINLKFKVTADPF